MSCSLDAFEWEGFQAFLVPIGSINVNFEENF